jgi:hypothetical protein
MNSSKIEYKTLDEIKFEIIKKIMINSSAISVTRCYESLTGSLISHSVGEGAPTGKFKIIC